MKVAMIVLGIIGSLIAMIGSITTMAGGIGGTATGVMSDSSDLATGSTFVFWSGALSLVVGFLSLIFSIVGGASKKKRITLTFALATLFSGLISIYLYNWISGAVVALAGCLGFSGAKENVDDNVPMTRSPAFYSVAIVMISLLGSAAIIKNGKSIVRSGEATAAAATSAPPPVGTAPAPTTIRASKDERPFVGRRTFNFYGGSGTGQSVTIAADGTATIEHHGSSGSSTSYQGLFTNPILEDGGVGYLFRAGKIYLLMDGEIEKDCQLPGTECVSDLYQ